MRMSDWSSDVALPICSGCVTANAHALARYAAMAQEAGLVPIVEPEVLMDGDHDIDVCEEVTEEVLRSVFNELCLQNVWLEGKLLKTNTVISGPECSAQADVQEGADRTLRCLQRTGPAALTRPGEG